MAFEFAIQSDDFFGALKPLIPKGRELAHQLFEQILLKEGRIKEGEYDRKKGSMAIEVTSLKIKDDSYGFYFQAVSPNATPSIDELEEKIDEIQALMSSLHVYARHPYPDEKLEGQIEIENMPLSSGVFSISLDARRYHDGYYNGYITISYSDLVLNFKEATRLIETGASRWPKYHATFVAYGEPDREFAKRLVEDLRRHKVTCWFYSQDYTPGERTWKEVKTRRLEAERVIVICSVDSLTQDGLLKEIEEQGDDNPDKIIPVSRDDIWRKKNFFSS
jgi:hypothetical protein